MFEREYQKEYDAYMEIVSNSFVKMQEVKTVLNDYNLLTPTYTTVELRSIEWNGGLEWKFINCGTTYLFSNLVDNQKKQNAIIANKYLTENTLTYSEWVEKVKTNIVDDSSNQMTPVVSGSDIHKEIYKCLEELSNNIGTTLNEYHWREICGLMKSMEDEELIKITWK